MHSWWIERWILRANLGKCNLNGNSKNLSLLLYLFLWNTFIQSNRFHLFCFCGINVSNLIKFVLNTFCRILSEGWNLIILGHELNAINVTLSVLYTFICLDLACLPMCIWWWREKGDFGSAFWCPSTPFWILNLIHVRERAGEKTLQADCTEDHKKASKEFFSIQRNTKENIQAIHDTKRQDRRDRQARRQRDRTGRDK